MLCHFLYHYYVILFVHTSKTYLFITYFNKTDLFLVNPLFFTKLSLTRLDLTLFDLTRLDITYSNVPSSTYSQIIYNYYYSCYPSEEINILYRLLLIYATFKYYYLFVFYLMK